jgi:protein-disulfide isomerase
VDADDAVLGSPTAPITLVVFTDFQCPFCSRAHPTLEELSRGYGHDKIRVVFKHNPLPFHQDAMPAALAAQAVHQVAGPQAFFNYVNLLFANQRALTDANLESWAAQVGARNVSRAASSAEVREKVERDKALAASLGLSGTPSFMINGQKIVGAQPVERFREVIDAELTETAALRRSGVPAEDVYARRVEHNRGQEPPDDDRPAAKPSAPAAPDTTVWKVPVGKSPTKGAADALVTIVAFLDFQCPFCVKSQATLAEVQKRYGTKVRLVFKHNPLPFHPRALPAAIFALEVRAQKGDKAFWEAAAFLFEHYRNLEEDDLLAYADDLKLNKTRLKASLKAQRYKKNIEGDQDLAADVEARGTPAFFINGRKLNGAMPLQDFTSLIDSELAKAEAKVKAGTRAAQVYASIIKDGKSGGSFEVKTVAAPSKDNPSRGAGKAPVTIQMWSDFQCPFCKRVNATIEELEKHYGWKVRVVWRNMPLPFHKDARLAAAAAMEAHAQGGSKAFWKMHELLFAGQATPDGLKRSALEGYAKSLGLDATKFADALDSGKHDSLIQSDEGIASKAGISGTPAFVINGYYLSGAQPIRAFKRVVDRALEDSKLGRKPAP